jgi:hypothetical protein
MKVEENGNNSRSGRIIASAFVVLAILLGTMQIALMPVSAAPVSIDPVPGTRTTYELNIEVDYYPGLLTQEVIDAFDFLESYFEARNISTEVDFNSTNNVIEGDGYLEVENWGAINRQYHDQPRTHIQYLIAKQVDGRAGGGSLLWGAAIGLDKSGPYDIRFLVMHEFGHCIGVGLQDDDVGREVYSSSGFMGYNYPNITEYRAEDWESAFAPDDAYGDSIYTNTRIWNRSSIIGEHYDDTSSISGVINGEMYLPDFGSSIILTNMENEEYYYELIFPDKRNFTFLNVKPGNYTLEMPRGYQLNNSRFINVTERQNIYLGNLTVEPAEIVPEETLQDNRLTYVLAAIFVTTILVLAFALWVRKNEKETANYKIMAAVVIAVVLLVVPSYFYLGPNDLYDAVTVNGFYDDRVDRNNDRIIDQEDAPFAWHSYDAGDRVVIRDEIEVIWFQTDENQTYIMLSPYSGKYWGESFGINVMVPGNVTDVYSKGDIIMVTNRLIALGEGSLYPDFSGWTIVG